MGFSICLSQKGPRFIQSNEEIRRIINWYGATIATFETIFKSQEPKILKQRIIKRFIFVTWTYKWTTYRTCRATIGTFKTSSKPQEPNILKQRITRCSIFVSFNIQNGRLTKSSECTKSHNSYLLLSTHDILLCTRRPVTRVPSSLTARHSPVLLCTRQPVTRLPSSLNARHDPVYYSIWYSHYGASFKCKMPRQWGRDQILQSIPRSIRLQSGQYSASLKCKMLRPQGRAQHQQLVRCLIRFRCGDYEARFKYKSPQRRGRDQIPEPISRSIRLQHGDYVASFDCQLRNIREASINDSWFGA